MPGQGISIELGDKERTEFEDLSALIHARLHVWANLGGREVLRSAPDRTTDMAVTIGGVPAHRYSCIQQSRRVLRYTAKTIHHIIVNKSQFMILELDAHLDTPRYPKNQSVSVILTCGWANTKWPCGYSQLSVVSDS